ncbi:MAG: lipopolysaccharide biosynthesis protein [Opitutales bacterium]
MVRAGLWAFAGQGGAQIVNLVLILTLARLLTPEAFGIVAAAQVILRISLSVVLFGLGDALIQAEVLTRQTERTALTLMLGLAFVMSLVIYFAAPLLAELMNVPELVEIMQVMLLTFLLSAATNPSRSLLRREMRFKRIAIAELSSFTLVNVAVSLTLALLGWSYWALILGTLASSALQAFILLASRPVRPTLRIQRDECARLVNFGGGIFLANLMGNLSQRVDNLIVAATLGPTALGYYTRGFALLDMANEIFGSAFNLALFSGFSKLRRNKAAGAERRQPFLLSQAFAATLALPIVGLALLLADEIVHVALGQQWGPVVPLVEIFAFGAFFRINLRAAMPVPKSEGRVYSVALLNVLLAVLVAVGAFSASSFGLTGIAGAVLGALTIYYICVVGFALRLLELNWSAYIGALWPVFLPAGLASLSAWGGLQWIRSAIDSATVGSSLLTGGSVAAAYFLTYGLAFLGLSRQPIIKKILWVAREVWERPEPTLPQGADL